MSNELPQGWCYAFLGELGELSRGKSKHRPRNDPKLYGDSIPFIQTGEVARSKGRISSFSKMYSEFGVQQSRVFPSRTVCITIAANIADTGILGFDACFPDSIVGLITDDRLADPYFVEYFLRIIREDLAQFAPATAQANINLEILNKVVVPLPPLNEQKQIVAKIEELRDRHQRAKQALEAISELCDRFRQSVLTAAFRGDLTADWREENPDIKSASVLTGEADASLPSTWCFSSIGDVIESLKYGTSKKSDYETEGIPVLRIPNIGSRYIDHTDLKYANLSSKEVEELKLIPGDILLIRSNGSVSLVGKSAVVREPEVGFAYAGYLIRLRLNPLLINSKYLNLCLSSRDLRLQIEIPAKSTSGVHNINSQEVKKLRIPLPPIEEQKEIVHQIEALFKGIELIMQQYQGTATQLDRLNQSILAKAFRGELVEQDPNDEPASVLLERIRAEREKADNGKKTKGKRAKQLKLEV